MINDPVIIEAYSLIAEKEGLPGNYATHDMSHIMRVIEYCNKISRLVNLSDDDIAGIKIAALLHDIGCSNGSKGGHARRSYEWAKDYFQNKEIDAAAKEKILTAISEHSEGATSLYGIILLFADKIDICDKRILPQGRLIVGNRQYAHIRSVDFHIKDGKLIVEFNTDGEMDIDEMNEYYFTKKVFQSVEGLAVSFGLDYEILIDGLEQ